jgi:hypothetical protein
MNVGFYGCYPFILYLTRDFPKAKKGLQKIKGQEASRAASDKTGHHQQPTLLSLLVHSWVEKPMSGWRARRSESL